MRDGVALPSKNRRGRGGAVGSALLLGTLLLLAVGCYIPQGWVATTTNPGLGDADLVAALPAERGWASWPDGAEGTEARRARGRVKEVSSRFWLTVSLTEGERTIEVRVHRDDRRALDHTIAELTAAHPELGPWEIEDITDRSGGLNLILFLGGMVLLVAALFAMALRIERRIRRRDSAA